MFSLQNYQETDCLSMKSLMAAVSGSEKPLGPWYVSKHLSNEAPPSKNERLLLNLKQGKKSIDAIII